jgi:integrase
MELLMGVLMRKCPWRTVADIRPKSFIDWRKANPGMAAKTLNEYLGCARACLNWLVKTGRLRSNLLDGVEKVEMRGQQVRNRRSLAHDEFLRLVEAGGEDRGVVYAVGYYTGLRRAEIASLCWGDFDLAAGRVTIRAEHAKNKTTTHLPLHPDLRDMLVAYFEICGSPRAIVKALKVPSRMRAFDLDLKAAGIAKRDEQRRVVDFHSLRHSCATRLASENVPLPVAMRLMRHSDPKLTAKAYVQQDALPLAESIGKLPGMPSRKKWSPDSSLEIGAEGHFES